MTKKLKRNLISAFFILFILLGGLIVGAFAPRSQLAHADELSNGDFYFEPGSALKINEDEEGNVYFNELVYTLKIDDLEHANILNYSDAGNSYKSLGKTIPAGSFFVYEFTTYRTNEDGSNSTALESFVVAYDYVNAEINGDVVVVLREWHAKKELAPSPTELDVKFGFNYLLKTDSKKVTCDLDFGQQRLRDFLETNKYTILDKPTVYLNQNIVGAPYADDSLWGKISILTESPYARYYLGFKAYYNTFQGKNWLGKISYADAYSGEIHSDVRSIGICLNNCEENGGELNGIEEYFVDGLGYTPEQIAHAYEILEGALQTITVQYLVPIEGTPFATPKTATATVSSLKEAVFVDDVCLSLNLDSLNCFDSICMSFKKDTTTGIFTAVYYKSTWLRAITADGKSNDIFLDFNLSFADFYGQYVDRGILTNDHLEWIFTNKLVKKYPVLQSYGEEKIHGLFGFVVLPDDSSFSKWLVDSFDVKGSSIGIVETFSYDGTLSYEDYEKLLDDYKYSNFEKMWNTAGLKIGVSDADAKFHFFYSEPGTESALIGEGGQKNPDDGSIVQQSPKLGFKFFRDWFANWSSMISKNNSERSFSEKVGLVVIIALIIYLIYWIFFKKHKGHRR